MTVAAVVVAGGLGTRYGGPKQFAAVEGDSVAARSVRASRSVAARVVLVVPDTYDGEGEGADLVVTGGVSRAASVRAGLAHCTGADIVVVHDAARPLASATLFRAVVDAVEAGADAAIPGILITDTVKRIARRDGAMIVTGTVSRDDLVTVQTPQAFRRAALERAHANAQEATDDAALVEGIGGRVVIVEGEIDNIKITRPGDLEKVATFVRSAR